MGGHLPEGRLTVDVRDNFKDDIGTYITSVGVGKRHCRLREYLYRGRG